MPKVRDAVASASFLSTRAPDLTGDHTIVSEGLPTHASAPTEQLFVPSFGRGDIEEDFRFLGDSGLLEHGSRGP